MWQEHQARCTLCPWKVSWDTEEAAQFDSVWHVYLDHRDVWIERTGTDAPPDVVNLPGAYGRKLEPWESQA